MARKQTRRSISVCAETYARLKAVNESTGFSMSGMVETALAPTLYPERENQPTTLKQAVEEAGVVPTDPFRPPFEPPHE